MKDAYRVNTTTIEQIGGNGHKVNKIQSNNIVRKVSKVYKNNVDVWK